MRFTALFAAASAAAVISAANHPSALENQTVRINILSKKIRQIIDGDIPSMKFEFSPGSIITTGASARPIKIIEIKKIEGRAAVIADQEILFGPAVVDIASPSEKLNPRRFILRGENESRRYPLPLEIKFKNGNPEFIVTEDMLRYAESSASAELGYVSTESIEALHALTLVTHARAQLKKKSSHKGYDFCDLTHCQIYQGIISTKRPIDLAVIDFEKSENEFLFHSSCGGKTYGPAVFACGGGAYGSVKDILFKEKIVLCEDAKDKWSREISSSRLTEILFEESGGDADIVYDNKIPQMTISRGGKISSFAPEEFRLRINRVLGWNFIRSNNYILTRADNSEKKIYRFEGAGLGHGVGLCQKGAIELARRGFSRYEILYHYYPSIRLKPGAAEKFHSPNLSWLIFDLNSGEEISSSSPSIKKRKIAPGSIFKLMTAVYLAQKRPDLLAGHEYVCAGKSNDHELIERCWLPEGHGRVDSAKAISMSCNLYFSSLSKKINTRDFVEFCNSFFSEAGMGCRVGMPAPENIAKFTVGLDDSFLFSINDFSILTRFLFAENPDDKKIQALRMKIQRGNIDLIRKAASEVFITGTASGKLKEFGPVINRIGLPEYPYENYISGKTSTIVDGTEHPVIYGLFIGAKNGIGIITILRNGNGHLAARWAQRLLHIE